MELTATEPVDVGLEPDAGPGQRRRDLGEERWPPAGRIGSIEYGDRLQTA
jgi:hypothetical protein